MIRFEHFVSQKRSDISKHNRDVRLLTDNRWGKATGQHPGGAGLLRFPTKQREAFYQSAKEVYREINYTGT